MHTWNHAVSEAHSFVQRRTEYLPVDRKSWRWLLELHNAAIRTVEEVFGPPTNDAKYNALASLFGKDFADRMQSPSSKDILDICSSCCCASAAINIASPGEDRLLVTSTLLKGIAHIYNKPASVLESWISFVTTNREDALTPDSTYIQTVGARTFFEIVIALSLLNPKELADQNLAFPTEIIDSWSRFWFNIVLDITNAAKERYESHSLAMEQTSRSTIEQQRSGCAAMVGMITFAFGAGLLLIRYS